MGKNMPPILFDSEDKCCGCSACYSICPVRAITMKENDAGFKYPVIDAEKCVNCGSCVKVCAFQRDLKEEKTKSKNSNKIIDKAEIYGVKSKNANVLESSSSGGMFTELTDLFLKSGNAVISCIYNSENYSLEYKLYTDKSDRDKARGSKYIQAEMQDIFNKGANWLRENPEKNIIFFGTGCQTSGFQKFSEMKKISDRILFIDLICNGVPSPGLWRDYVNYLENKHNGKAGNVSFKDKRDGWMKPTVYLMMDDNEISIKPYSDWFYGEYSLRKSCFQCPYTKINRSTDITIGDFWGIDKRIPEFYNPKGVSLVIVHSEKGKKIFDQLKSHIDYIKSDEKTCLQPRLISSAAGNSDNDNFWKDYKKKGVSYCVRKYKRKSNISLFLKIKIKLRSILMKLKIIKS